MTNGEKLIELFYDMDYEVKSTTVLTDIDGRTWFSLDWWNAEYKEPTTKKCTTCAYRKIDGKPHEMCKSCVCGNRYKEESTTKNDLGVEHHKQNIQAYAHDFGVSEEQAEKELRVTIKNDLADDCISRKAVIDELKRYFHDEYYQRTSIQDCRDCFIEDVLNHLPSATPIRPKGHWTYHRNEKGNWENICSNCGLDSGVGYPYPYCPSCGAEMREVKDGTFKD